MCWSFFSLFTDAVRVMPRLSVVAFVLERDSVEPWTTFAAAYLPTHNIISAATTEEFLV